MVDALSKTEIQQELEKLNQGQSSAWQVNTDKLCKTFVFNDFVGAFGWMCKIAIHAEKMNHHPEWFNVYNRVNVELTTHDAGGITELDFALAETMDDIA